MADPCDTASTPAPSTSHDSGTPTQRGIPIVDTDDDIEFELASTDSTDQTTTEDEDGIEFIGSLC